jgi:hypothetical protein
MLKSLLFAGALLVLLGLSVCQSTSNPPQNIQILADFGDGFALDRVSTEGDARVSHSGTEETPALLVHSESEELSVRIAAENAWDLSSLMYVRMDLSNPGSGQLYAECRINGKAWMDGARVIPPGETRTISALIKRLAPPDSITELLFGMNGLPGGYVWIWDVKDAREVDFVEVRFPYIRPGAEFEISNLRAEGVYETAAWDSNRFPLLDEFGQFRGHDWPGKIHSEAEFLESTRLEDQDLAAHPGPKEWNEFGGWSGGPALEATGHFRTTKHEGRWWLVDPSGHLFWSHGIDCVRSGSDTPITDREHYFTQLPPDSSSFYTNGSGAAREYYKDRSYRMFNLRGANLERKFGANWEEVWAQRAHQRLRSWGLNTIACWSSESVYLRHKTPYVVYLNSGGPSIEGAEGFWRKFPDPFSEGFRKSLAESLAQQRGKSTDDRWCIGYFVDNELSWGSEGFLARSVLQSPSDQAAKKELQAQLRSRYSGIAQLNEAWGSNYSSWDNFLETREVPQSDTLEEDLKSFNLEIARKYHEVINEEIKQAAPNKLYLGSRMALHAYPDESNEQEWLVQVAAEFCDIVSFNRYRFTCLELGLPEGVDKPVIIGEFHFGALDRGMLHTGLRSTYDQAERAEQYRFYVEQALENPYLVGTHWFQMNDQVTTGRRDGENYQIGFLDICDNPYPETIEASRAVGKQLYRFRAGMKLRDASSRRFPRRDP